MKALPDGCVDAVITDPPYGIGADKHKAHSSIRDNEKWTESEWDVLPNPDFISELTRVSRRCVIWGGNYFPFPPSQCWLVWSKPERNFSLADAELAWTNMKSSVRVFDYRRVDGIREHPTQKPVVLMEWCITKAGMPETIIDPYCGSGSTLVAAARLGRHFLGIEISPDYCKIARERIALVENQPNLFQRTEVMRQQCIDYNGDDKIGALSGELDCMVELEMLKGKR